jgi:hypothetical protein
VEVPQAYSVLEKISIMSSVMGTLNRKKIKIFENKNGYRKNVNI